MSQHAHLNEIKKKKSGQFSSVVRQLQPFLCKCLTKELIGLALLEAHFPEVVGNMGLYPTKENLYKILPLINYM